MTGLSPDIPKRALKKRFLLGTFGMLLLGGTISIASISLANANPIDDLTGFYVEDPNDCLYAKGTLYLCQDGGCISQDYNHGASASPEFLKGSATQIVADGIDANGFTVAEGEISLSFGNIARVLRFDGTSLQTTNLGRKIGATTISFIRDGVAVDPSARAQELKQCPAYAEAAKQWLADGRAPQKVEPQAPKATAVVFEKFESLIPMTFEPPVPYARILEVVPIQLGDPEYPALIVLWVLNVGGTPLPLQVLTYDRSTNSYVDDPARVYATGEAPLVDNPRAVALFDSQYGPGVVVANSGMDRDPFPRTTNMLLMPNSEGLLVNYERSLVQDKEFSHDVSSGVINADGDWGIYVNSMYIPHYYIMRDDRLIKANDRLPAEINRDDQKFTSSALADINGDGFADLILGTVNEAHYPSVIYINNGRGGFTGPAIPLTPTPFPQHKMQFVDRMTGAGVLDIQPVKLDVDQAYWDLIVVSNDSYMGYSIQLLKNDGGGNFVDVSSERFKTPDSVYFSPLQKPYTWMYRTVLFATDEGVDIIAKSESRYDVPSYVFGNNGDNTFSVVEERIGTNAITNAATFGGDDMLIEIGVDNRSVYLTAYPQ